MVEIWKPVEGYESYSISNEGRIKSTRKWGYRGGPGGIERVLKCSITHYGYKAVRLYGGLGNKDRLIHRLVAEAFLGPCPVGKEVNHKDGVKTNNRIENLEYVTDSEQRQHAYDTGLQKKGADRYNSKLNPEKAELIRSLRGKMKGREIAKMLGVSPQIVCQVQKGTRW